jgi:lysophospholipase L1-like esterase
VILVGMPEHPRLSAALDSALDRIERGERAGAASGVAAYFALRDSVLLWTWSDYDVMANAIARRAGRSAAAEWPHRRAPANVALATARSYDRVAAEVAAEEGIRFVDAVEALGGRPELFMDECHFDARGHALVAELLLGPVAESLGSRVPADVR